MSDFRKPYEYEEERANGGFLLLFFFMLLIVEVLLGATTMFQCQRALRNVPSLGAVVIAAGSAYILFILITAVALRKNFPLGVSLSKVFLVVRVILLVPAYVFLYASPYSLPVITLDLKTPLAILMTMLVAPIAYVIVFSAVWYPYFLKSWRVRKLLEAAPKRG